MKFELNRNLFYVNDGIVGVDNKAFDENRVYYDTKQEAIRYGSNNHATGGYKKRIIFVTANLNLKDIPVLELPKESTLSSAIDTLFPNWESKDVLESSELKQIEAFQIGYNKAKETYKYTEEDVKKAIESSHEYDMIISDDGSPKRKYYYSKDEVIQQISQPKKIQSIEVEEINNKVVIKNIIYVD